VQAWSFTINVLTTASFFHRARLYERTLHRTSRVVTQAATICLHTVWEKDNFDLITALIWSYHVRHHVHNDTSAGTAWFLFPDHAPYNFKPSHAWKAGWDLEWLQILTDGLSIKMH
jgi:hypothetical protein